MRSYQGTDITVRYDVTRCIHAAECVRGLRSVFDPDAKPWVDPDGAPADEVARVIHRCPTGALSYDRSDRSGAAGPPIPTPVELSVCEDGPVYAHGDVRLVMAGSEAVGQETRLALCRCGASANKPFCDNSHAEVGFEDGGVFERESGEQTASQGHLEMTPLPNGPVLLRGSFVLTSADGSCEFRGDKAALCRCGASGNKPFCDGAHAQIGFQAD
jgi:CDGSH-type Zn-finger protein/uncharacterized Fe-S cluster protein YjdI